jgi:hypothetical protein
VDPAGCASSAGPVRGAASEADCAFVIYDWNVAGDVILLLLAYPKNEQDDLTPAQLKILKSTIETEFP